MSEAEEKRAEAVKILKANGGQMVIGGKLYVLIGGKVMVANDKVKVLQVPKRETP